MMRSLRNIVAVALMMTLVAAHQRALAENMWDLLIPEKLQLVLFCEKHVGHPRCKKIEQERLFCKNNPTNDRCKEQSASTVLLWCEHSDPESQGKCDAELGGDARAGAGLPSLFGMPARTAALPEWQCVPKAVIDDWEQLRRLFIREANRMPEVLHLPARQLLYYAVAKAFPCPLRNPPPDAR